MPQSHDVAYDVVVVGAASNSLVTNSWDASPLAEFAQYRIPGLEALYLAGPFEHPAGTVTFGGRALDSMFKAARSPGMDWIPFVVFGAWVTTMSVSMLRAIRRQRGRHPAIIPT